MHPRIETFGQFGFSSALTQRLGEFGREAPSHVQAACIPTLLAGRDLLAHADTGTGKTPAFVLPIYHQGTAILLVAPREMGMLPSIEHATRQAIDVRVPPERFREPARAR